MKRFFYPLLIGLLIFSTSGCGTLFFGYQQAKELMDYAEQINKPVDDVWKASLRAAEELSIVVEGKEFYGGKGLISGHAGKLDYIRIHIEQLEPELTLVATQARTSAMPMTSAGLDKEFARSIIEQIKKNLGKATVLPPAKERVLGEEIKLRVKVAKATIRLNPELEAMVISEAPFGVILDSEGKIGEWYLVNLPPDESGFVISGYIHQSKVEVLEVQE